MKKLFAFLLPLVALTACNDTPAGQEDRTAVRFTGGINIATRAADGAWEKDDAIGIFMVTAGSPLGAASISETADNRQYLSGAAGASAGFTPVSDTETVYFPVVGNVDFYAYYPYGATGGKVVDYRYAVNVADQSEQEDIDFMYADKVTGKNKNDKSVQLHFRHMLSKVVMQVEPGAGLSEADLAGLTVKVKGRTTDAQFDLSAGTLGVASGSADIAMKTTEAGKKYEAILLPADGSCEFEFDLNNGHDLPFTWTKTDGFVAGTKYNYTKVVLNRTEAEVSGTIEDWNEKVFDTPVEAE